MSHSQQRETPRRTGSLIYDSADDAPSETRSQPGSPAQLSVSEFGELTLRASSSAGTSLMQDRDSAMGDTLGSRPSLPGQAEHEWRGDMEREDSASYQRRPPALAERQDSASNLQALAEAEADLLSGRPESAALELAQRRDSAADLHLQPQPQQQQQQQQQQGAGSQPSPTRPGHDSARSSMDGSQALRVQEGMPGHLRTDSASELPRQQQLQQHHHQAGVHAASPPSLLPAGPPALQNPFQSAASAMPSSPWHPADSASPPEGSLLDSAEPATLTAARRLVQSESAGLQDGAQPQASWGLLSSSSAHRHSSTGPFPEPSGLELPRRASVARSPDSASERASPHPEASELDIAYRQDSALDTLAAARQAVLPALVQAAGGSGSEARPGPGQAPTDPLVQARRLVGSWQEQDAAGPSDASWQGPASPAQGWRQSLPGSLVPPDLSPVRGPAAYSADTEVLRSPVEAGDPHHAYPDSPINVGGSEPGITSAFDVLQRLGQGADAAPALLQQDVQ